MKKYTKYSEDFKEQALEKVFSQIDFLMLMKKPLQYRITMMLSRLPHKL